MSYVNKKSRVFNESPGKNVQPIRSEARMKKYISNTDHRTWCDVVEDRRQQFLEFAARKAVKEFCPGSIIPVEVLAIVVVGWKQAQIEKMQQKVAYLQKRIELYAELNLTEAQKEELKELTKNI